jgi:hypothetical protein
MNDRASSRTVLARAGARGMVAAMAMTGVRTVTAGIGEREKTPPQVIVDKHAPPQLLKLPDQHRRALTELMHWTYGAGGGVVFGLLPAAVRRHPAAGPAYGLAAWTAFELGLAPLLGLERARRHSVLAPALVAADHVLYGVVVAGQLAPEPARK